MSELTIVILIATALSILARLFKQPLFIAYLATGFLIGALHLFSVPDNETFRVFSSLGIMLLLFLVGMEINYTSLRLVGKTALIVGVAQIGFTFAGGYPLARFFGFSSLEAAYLAIALTFSSTIIVVKLLSEKRDMASLYGKISIGFLLVQDFAAILLLVFLTGLGAGREAVVTDIVFTVVKGVGLFAFMLFLGRKVLPYLFDCIARSAELLFLTSLAWVFLVAFLVGKAGFSIEIGGFLAGIALANSGERFEISNRVKPLRDFFVLIFFVILGSAAVTASVQTLLVPTLVFSLFVLIGNPLIVLCIMAVMGYRRRTSLFTALTVAQISEFSLILATLGLRLGHLTEGVVAIVTAVGVITITLSTYLIVHADRVFHLLNPVLVWFERRNLKEETLPKGNFEKPIILIGAHRTGESIASSLPKDDLLIIDFDPDVIRRLRKRGFTCMFGDITDTGLFSEVNIAGANLIISTSPQLEDNLALLEQVKNKARPRIILRAETEEDARILYARHADYVLLPHFTAGQYLGKTIAIDPEFKILSELKAKDEALLRESHGTNS